MGARFVKDTSTYQVSLLNNNGDIVFSTVNLLLSGRAAPYLHNGTQFREEEDNEVSESTSTVL